MKVRDGVVTLMGYACSHFEKHQAELAVKLTEATMTMTEKPNGHPGAQAEM
jgi:hypothetical protein